MALAVQHAGATPVVQSAASLEERSPRRMGVASSLDTAVTASAAPGDRGPMAPPLDNLMATTASTQVAQAKSADTPEAALQARPGTADFAPQLGSQLAVWVRDGVQEARLQLNPADMGPVRVEIQLDGNAAQVSLSASNSETRQALEAAMPSLAGSLRELGLTLAGGGVFDQTPQPREQAGSSSPSPLSAAAANAGSDGGNPPGAVFQPRRRGLVDLVA